jgi:hypothetical protein
MNIHAILQDLNVNGYSILAISDELRLVKFQYKSKEIEVDIGYEERTTKEFLELCEDEYKRVLKEELRYHETSVMILKEKLGIGGKLINASDIKEANLKAEDLVKKKGL